VVDCDAQLAQGRIPRARKSRSKFSKAASNPSTALSSASATRLAGTAVLGSVVVSAGAVAVGAALLFESGFRRRGAGLLASACSVVGSDSRQRVDCERQGSAFSPTTPMRSAIFHVVWRHRSWVARPSGPPWLSPCRSRDKYQKHYEKPTSRHNRNRDGDEDSKADGKPHGFLSRLVKL
jgi:hypothetical protein